MTDTDRDGFPDAQLTTCPDNSQEAYCMVDTCPEIFNVRQSDNPCLPGLSLGVYSVLPMQLLFL